MVRRQRESLKRSLGLWVGVALMGLGLSACGGGSQPAPPAQTASGGARGGARERTEAPLRHHSEIARHPGLQLREDRRRARGEGDRQHRDHLARAGDGRSAPPEGNPRIVHHPARRRHRDLLHERRLPDADDQQGGRSGHPGRSPGTPTRRSRSGWRSTASTTSRRARSWRPKRSSCSAARAGSR